MDYLMDRYIETFPTYAATVLGAVAENEWSGRALNSYLRLSEGVVVCSGVQVSIWHLCNTQQITAHIMQHTTHTTVTSPTVRCTGHTVHFTLHPSHHIRAGH